MDVLHVIRATIQIPEEVALKDAVRSIYCMTMGLGLFTHVLKRMHGSPNRPGSLPWSGSCCWTGREHPGSSDLVPVKEEVGRTSERVNFILDFIPLSPNLFSHGYLIESPYDYEE
jgi:hypothetical protein